MTSPSAKPSLRPITAIVVAGALALPLLTILVSRIAIGASYRISPFVVPLGVADAVVLGGFGLLAFVDYSSALEHGRNPSLTTLSLVVGSVILCGVMLAGGVALEQGVHADGTGSSTNGLAVIFIPVYSVIAATLGYATVWIAGTVRLWWIRRRASGERRAA